MSSEVFIVIDDSTSKSITGVYEFDSDNGGKLAIPSGTSFPVSPLAKELFWRSDEKKLYRRNDGNAAWDAVIADSPTVTEFVQETHLVTAGEVATGHFSLSSSPTDANTVSVSIYEGIMQVNKVLAGSTGAVPDYEIQNTTECHINSNGGATGLSGDIVEGTVLQISYTIITV